VDGGVEATLPVKRVQNALVCELQGVVQDDEVAHALDLSGVPGFEHLVVPGVAWCKCGRACERESKECGHELDCCRVRLFPSLDVSHRCCKKHTPAF
jgi:hypothetical protein